MQQKSNIILLLISLLLSIIVFAVLTIAKDTPYADLALISVGILTALLFILFVLYFAIAQFVSLICKKDILVKGIASAYLIYIGIFAIALSSYPDVTNKMLEKWDFRFAAFGIALVSFAIALLPKDRSLATRRRTRRIK